jgi:large subunit ribosomal protein L24
MSRIKTHVRKGDTVEVIAGNHKGATGTILQVLPEKGQVLVEGVRMIKRHQRRNAQYPEGGIIEKEGPIHISNVRKVEPAKPAKKKAARKRAKA